MSYKINEKMITNKTNEIGSKYPVEFNYGSKRSLWSRALNHGLVTLEEFNSASEYYGNLWSYAGD